MRIGKLIKEYRVHNRKMSLRKFSDRYNIPIATLSRIERGKPISISTMGKLIRWLFE